MKEPVSNPMMLVPLSWHANEGSHVSKIRKISMIRRIFFFGKAMGLILNHLLI
jgi:hypothetical protein